MYFYIYNLYIQNFQNFLSVLNISKQVEYFIEFYLQYELTWTLATLFIILVSTHSSAVTLETEGIYIIYFTQNIFQFMLDGQ